MTAASDWWQGFFDADYASVWGMLVPPEHTAAEVDGLWTLCALAPGSRVLDAPCGYGRLARRLAERGAIVLGVDQSAALLARAERERGGLADRLRYLHQDLRTPLRESGFDVALDVFSSIGYGSEEDDLAVLRTLAGAVRPGGLVFVETMHRDAFVARYSRGLRPGSRLPDGTLMVEEPRFDPLAGRVATTWYWSGPAGSGAKTASLRLYTPTELVRLASAAGLTLRSLHRGASPQPFAGEGPDMGGRLGALFERVP